MSRPLPPDSSSKVADLERRNEELQARVDALSNALQQSEAVFHLSAGAAHDVRNALVVVLGEGDLLSRSALDVEQRESVEALLSAGNNAHAVLGDLLHLARRGDGAAEVVDTSELMIRCRPLIQRIVRQRIECVFEVDEGPWPVAVKPQQLEAALINLSANARDAMPKGGRLCVSVRNLPRGAPVPPGLSPGDHVVFRVEDCGFGMSPEVAAKATQAFFTTKDPGRGTGLGLSTVEAFATRSGGALQIESEVGRGTRVEIILPRAHVIPRQFSAAETAVLDKIRERIRSQRITEVLDHWCAVSPHCGLPRPVQVEAALLGKADWSMTLRVDREATPPTLRLVRIGAATAKALGTAGVADVPVDGSLAAGTHEAAYRRALTSPLPMYEYANYSFGEGVPAEFERVILPASQDGEQITHLIGVVVLSTAPPTEE